MIIKAFAASLFITVGVLLPWVLVWDTRRQLDTCKKDNVAITSARSVDQ